MIIATAGHIDHGKTLLIRALTGTDTDRLPEEKQRAMTIDLGFAYLPIKADRAIAFIDVPGHERFIRNMVCGAAGIALWSLSWPPTTASCRRPANTSRFLISLA